MYWYRHACHWAYVPKKTGGVTCKKAVKEKMDYLEMDETFTSHNLTYLVTTETQFEEERQKQSIT